MGSDPARDPEARGPEQPQHQASSRTFIARFPVTVAQFRAFVQDARYQPAEQGNLRGLSIIPSPK